MKKHIKLSESNLRFKSQQRLVENVNDALQKLSRRITEAKEPNKKKQAVKEIASAWKATKDKLKNPDDIIKWYEENIKIAEEKLKDPDLPPKARKMLERSIKTMNYALTGNEDGSEEDINNVPPQEKLNFLQRTKAFVKKHWFKIVVLVFIISLFCTGGSTALATPEVAGAIQAGEIAGVGKSIIFAAGGLGYLWNSFLSVVGVIPGLGTIVRKLMIGI